jgi:hypothetical protein
MGALPTLSGLLKGAACSVFWEQEFVIRELDFTGLEVNEGMLQRGLRPRRHGFPILGKCRAFERSKASKSRGGFTSTD